MTDISKARSVEEAAASLVTTSAEGQKQEASKTSVSPPMQRYALCVLLLVYTVNALDRAIPSILAEPIKDDLNLSDTQLGLLTGLAFGLLYCGMGLPLARLADRYNRPRLITIYLSFWSICTLICGQVSNFTGLFLARMGVGLGESGFVPTAHALITDLTPKERRASALAFFAMGTAFGSLAGLAMGGIIADAHGWRAAFLVAGVPGLVLAALVFFTLPEPRRSPARAGPTTDGRGRHGLLPAIRHLATKPTYWYMTLGLATKMFIAYGQQPFTGSFFLRVHGEEIARMAALIGLKPIGFLGLVMGLTAGVFGAFSTWLGGYVADRFGSRDLRAYASVPAFASLATVPLLCATYAVDSAALALALMIPTALLSGLAMGPVYATAQGVVPLEMRATSAAILVFLINVVGLAVGAVLVGSLSDFFNLSLGLGESEGIRLAMITCSALGLVGAFAFYRARSSIRADVIS